MASARPVSGEIMTASQAPVMPVRDLSPSCDIIDADFEVLSPPSPADPGPGAAPIPAPTPATPPLQGMAMLRPSGRRRPFSVRGGPLFWAAGLAAVMAAFWASGGHVLIRHSGLFAGGSDDPSLLLSITDLTSHVDASGEKPVLLIDGEAGNDGAQTAALPQLEIRVTGEDGGVTHYTLGTSGRALAPGQRFAFSSRLDVPRNGVKAVAVTFAE